MSAAWSNDLPVAPGDYQPTVSCDACAGRGGWASTWFRRGPGGGMSQWANTCPVCRGAGTVSADLPVIYCTVVPDRGVWVAQAWADGVVIRRRTSTLGWVSAAKQLGYQDDRPHHEYKRRFRDGYRIILDRSHEPSREGAVGVSAGSGRDR